MTIIAVASARHRSAPCTRACGPDVRGGGSAQSGNRRGARREVPVVIDKVLRAGEGRILRRLKRIADQVNSIEEEFAAMSDAELRGMTTQFRERLAEGDTLDDLL